MFNSMIHASHTLLSIMLFAPTHTSTRLVFHNFIYRRTMPTHFIYTRFNYSSRHLQCFLSINMNILGPCGLIIIKTLCTCTYKPSSWHIKPLSSCLSGIYCTCSFEQCTMSSSVKNFTVGYNPLNKSNTFSSGDYLMGQVTFELTNECEVQSLFVKLKGKAQVSWTENYGKTIVTYQSKEKYFSIKQFVIQESMGKLMSFNLAQCCNHFKSWYV